MEEAGRQYICLKTGARPQPSPMKTRHAGRRTTRMMQSGRPTHACACQQGCSMDAPNAQACLPACLTQGRDMISAAAISGAIGIVSRSELKL